MPSISGFKHDGTCSPTFDLPVEILAKIFMECKPVDFVNLNRWFTFAHVCRRWRDIALDHPLLWSEISNCMGPRWQEIMFQRSKDSLLSIHIFPFYAPTELLPCLRHANRLEHVYISFGRWENSADLLSQMTSSAPFLTTLSLINQGPALTIPDHFLNGDAPRLRELRLKSFYNPWTSPLLRRLTSFRYWNLYSMDVVPPPPPLQFLDGLAQMTSLRTLDLGGTLPDLSSLHPNCEAALPHLEQLRLHGACGQLHSILQRLRIPRSVALRLRCRLSATVDDYTPILKFLSTSSWLASPITRSQIPFPQLRNARIEQACEVMKITVYQYQQSRPSAPRGESDGYISLALYRNRGPHEYDDAPLITASRASPNIRSLHIVHLGNPIDWFKAMANAPYLTSIEFLYKYSSDFFQILQTDVLQDQPTGGAPVTFPTYFSHLEIIKIVSEGCQSTAIPVDEWVNILVARSKLGAKHVQLYLEACPLQHKRDITRLHDGLEGVAAIHWIKNAQILCRRYQCNDCNI